MIKIHYYLNQWVCRIIRFRKRYLAKNNEYQNTSTYKQYSSGNLESPIPHIPKSTTGEDDASTQQRRTVKTNEIHPPLLPPPLLLRRGGNGGEVINF
jgi:hypothetical protein